MTAPDGPNDLVVAPENEDAVPWGSPEGAGVVSSWADVGNATGPENAFWATAAAGLDAAMNPLDALGTAGIGYLIEHVWFLHEPLDAFAGDPTQITAQARTWHNVAEELRALAGDHRVDVAAVSGWEGTARDAYGVSAAAYSAELQAAGDAAAELAELVLGTGVLVATERAVLRDLIAGFVWNLVERFLAWLVGAFFTAGAALVVGVTWAVIDALDFAAGLVRRIETFLEGMHRASGTATALAGRLRDIADRADAATPDVLWRGLGTAHSLRTTGAAATAGTAAALRAADAVTFVPTGSPVRPYLEVATSSPAGELASGVTELGKQYTSQGDNQEQWRHGAG